MPSSSPLPLYQHHCHNHGWLVLNSKTLQEQAFIIDPRTFKKHILLDVDFFLVCKTQFVGFFKPVLHLR